MLISSVEYLEKPKEASKVKAGRISKSKDAKSGKEKRPANAYNLFIKEEISKLRKEKPGLPNGEYMKLAAGNWRTSPSNPKFVQSK